LVPEGVPTKVAHEMVHDVGWLTNLAEEGKVVLVRGPWIDEFLDEVSRFPKGRHDDQIDAVSPAVRMLTHPDRRLFIM